MILDIPNTSERRQSPRYEIPLAVELVLDNDMILDVTSSNISGCGLKISCDSWIADEIEPRGIQSHTTSHLRLKVIIDLDSSAKKIYSNCRVISAQRIAQDEYTLSLAFIDFENGTENILNDFLDQHAKSRTLNYNNTHTSPA